jgi:hypothetical protein
MLATKYGHAYAIDERGDHAMLYFTGTPFTSPQFFHLGPQGWQIDIPAEIRNSQEFVATYYTWGFYRSGDIYSKVLADRYERIDGRGFQDFFRVRGGDDRALCIYGEPRLPPEKRLLASSCLPKGTPAATPP